MGARCVSLGALLAVLVVGCLGPSAAAADDPALAPVDCWTAEDGCPARSGEVGTRGLSGHLVEAWYFQAPAGAVIEEEPRVWHDRVVLALRLADGKRVLHTLSVDTGRPLAAPILVASDGPLEPSLADDLLLVKEQAGTLRVHAYRRGVWVRGWSVAARVAFHGPVLVGRRVFARDGDELVAFTVGREEADWRSPGPFRGRLAVRDGWVHALRYDPQGNGDLVTLDASSGFVFSAVFVAHHGRELDGSLAQTSRVAAHARRLLVFHADPVRLENGETRSSSRYQPRAPGAGGRDRPGLYADLPEAAGVGAGLLVVQAETPSARELWLWQPDAQGELRGWKLADRERQARLANMKKPPSVAGGVAYVGGLGFDLETRELVWSSDEDLSFRPVPARGRLLLCTARERLLALKSPFEREAQPVFLGRAAPPEGGGEAPPSVEGPARVLLVGGATLTGATTLVREPGVVRVVLDAKRTAEHPLSDVALVLDADGRPLYVRSALTAAADARDLADAGTGSAWLALAREGVKAKDPELLARLVREAERRVVATKDLESLRKQLQTWAKQPPKPVAALVASLTTKADHLTRLPEQASLPVLTEALVDARRDVRHAFLPAVLADGRLAERAAEVVRADLPEWLRPTPPFDVSAWLEVAQALHGSAVQPLVAPTAESKDLTRQQRELGSARHTWRPDLVGLQTEQLVVITPLVAPAQIAQCLALGEMVCQALDDVFAGGTNLRKDPWPMLLLLFPTQAEYRSKSLETLRSKSAEQRMEWSGGHFDPNAGLSRVWLPTGPDAFRTVMDVYAHELTHHWIEERCPLWRSMDSKGGPHQPGYWIVEGMAEMLAQYRWDLPRRAYAAFDPRADSLDVVANATAEQLLPWNVLFRVSSTSYDQFDWKDKIEVPSQVVLGSTRTCSTLGLFYDQSTAVCQFLHQRGGALRTALLDYVRDYYTGQADLGPDSFPRRFGMSADDLGRRAIGHARDVLAGRFTARDVPAR